MSNDGKDSSGFCIIQDFEPVCDPTGSSILNCNILRLTNELSAVPSEAVSHDMNVWTRVFVTDIGQRRVERGDI